MKKINIVLLASICSLFFISCQKELSMDSSLGLGGGGTGTLKGNWKFIGMHSKTEAVVELSDGIDVLKTITLSEYYSKNNTGIIVIDDSKMTGTNVGYEIDTIAKGLTYENNILIDTVSVPLYFIAPPANSVSPYIRVGADSLYFTGGQFSTLGGPATPTNPVGAKFQLQGDKLLLTVRVSMFDVQDIFGIRQSKKQSALSVFTYQKQ